MTISVDWPSRVILVPKADMTLIQISPIEVRELDMDVFRLALKALEEGEAGIPNVDTHRHNAPVTIGALVLAMVVEIINEYTVTFEDGAYLVNAVGANSNIADRMNPNNVSLRTANSAGLIVTSGGGGSGASAADVWAYGSRTLTSSAPPSAADNATAVWDSLTASHTVAGTFGKLMQKLLTVGKYLGLR